MCFACRNGAKHKGGPRRKRYFGLWCTADHIPGHNWPLQNAEIHIHQVNSMGAFHALTVLSFDICTTIHIIDDLQVDFRERKCTVK